LTESLNDLGTTLPNEGLLGMLEGLPFDKHLTVGDLELPGRSDTESNRQGEQRGYAHHPLQTERGPSVLEIMRKQPKLKNRHELVRVLDGGRHRSRMLLTGHNCSQRSASAVEAHWRSGRDGVDNAAQARDTRLSELACQDSEVGAEATGFAGDPPGTQQALKYGRGRMPNNENLRLRSGGRRRGSQITFIPNDARTS
jgi:hypothetical protein